MLSGRFTPGISNIQRTIEKEMAVFGGVVRQLVDLT